jgi:hypothetical protein
MDVTALKATGPYEALSFIVASGRRRRRQSMMNTNATV